MNAGMERYEEAAYRAQRLIDTFADCFGEHESTELVGGAQEPLYLPAQQSGELHRLYFREDYFASALHEVAHWCIAGARRRQQHDFGYWYAPDGRNEAQQRAFEAVECKPQALEWLFCLACAYPFRISLDNLDTTGQGMPEAGPFKQHILRQGLHWQEHGLPERAAMFFAALSEEFGTGLVPGEVTLNALDLR
jgi:elongation factor P hydroxylase